MAKNNRVTLKDVYEVVNRLEDKMDTRLKDLEDRVETNESFRNRFLGIAAVIGAFAGGAASIFWERITGKK